MIVQAFLPEIDTQGLVTFHRYATASTGPISVLNGDVDLSGEVDFADIPPFIVLLTTGGFQDEADCNPDGLVNFGDIPPFINILTGQ